MSPITSIIQKTQKHLQSVRLSKNIISYFICVLIATMVWLLNTLTKDYSTEVIFPIKYLHLPKDKYPITELPKQLQIEIQAKGFALLSYKLKTSFLPITLDFEPYSQQLRNSSGIFEYTLYTDNLKDKIATQMNSDIKLVNIYPGNIDFKFAAAKQKKVAVHPQLSYTLKPQYTLTQIQTQPDSIWVSGAETIIDTLQFITTQAAELDKLSKPTTLQLDLSNYPNLQFDVTSVKVLLEVEQFTTIQHHCPIIINNQPDSMRVRLFPAQLSISYHVGLSKYGKISEKDFVFAVDYPQDSETTFLEVKAIKVPPFIQNLTFSPKKVEYLLEKK